MPIRRKPAYFDRVWKQAHQRWEQLNADEGLAAPWWQLFRQIKSPSHVLSELLQNADDAGARQVRAGLNKEMFWFEHDGEDFDEDTFYSLCQFGFSNKRQLHTIGFRGLGFKSTFSFGECVEVVTPSLAVVFEEKRFTEPIWLDGEDIIEITQVRIRIDQAPIWQQARENLQQWIASPIPLLFFRNIEELELNGKKISKRDLGEGPTGNSRRVKLGTPRGTQEIIQITSPEVPFPEDALDEIRSERRLAQFDLPPCVVELVLGAPMPQQPYIILPSNVVLPLPFSCNAPFIQNPDRRSLKDPALSPTNNWLFKRIGQLAVTTMAEWLSNTGLSEAERAESYQLLPQPLPEAIHLPNRQYLSHVLEAFEKTGKSEPIVLTHTGEVARGTDCAGLPKPLFEVWAPAPLLKHFGEGRKFLAAPSLSAETLETLKAWGWLKLLEPRQIMERLARMALPPRPERLEQLLILWNYLAPAIRGLLYGDPLPRKLRIVPLAGRDYLECSNVAIMAGSRDARLSDEQWEFIIQQAPVVDPVWLDLTLHAAQGKPKSARDTQIPTAASLFNALGLMLFPNSLQRVLAQAAKQVFGRADPGAEGLSLAQLAAQLDIAAPPGFQLKCRDGQWRPVESGLLVDVKSDLATLLPPDWAKQRLIHQDYETLFPPAERALLQKWAVKSGLTEFPAPTHRTRPVTTRAAVDAFSVQHGGEPPQIYPYKRAQNYELEDCDYDPELWQFWQREAEKTPYVWAKVVFGIGRSWTDAWEKKTTALARQVYRSASQTIATGKLTARWLTELRAQPCLPDTQRKLHLPADLLRSTPETAMLSTVEEFVNPDFDRHGFHSLLDLLGVRSTPEGADKLIGRLRALSQTASPPLKPLLDLYSALERVLMRLSADKVAGVKAIFQQEKLIWANDGSWQTSEAIFQQNEEDIPGAVIINPNLADMNLWDRLGVARRPTLELVLEWLGGLAPRAKLEGPDRGRVRQILGRIPKLEWDEGRYWVSLSGEWTPIDDLKFTLDTPALDKGLFPWVRQATADVSMLDTGAVNRALFGTRRWLETALEQRREVTCLMGHRKACEWLATIGENLLRISPAAPNSPNPAADQLRELDRANAQRLRNTGLQHVQELKVVPYLDDQPAGETRTLRVLWEETTLYLTESGPAHHRELVETIATAFSDRRWREAIRDCAAREARWINEYFAAEFDLLPEAPETPEASKVAEAPAPPAGGPVPARDEAQPPKEEPKVLRVEDAVEASDAETEGAPETAATEKPQPAEPQPHIPGFRSHQAVEAHLADAGFVWSEHEKAFSNGDVKVTKAHGPLPWVVETLAGESLGGYWIGDRPLEKGVEIPAEAWEALKRQPNQSWMLLPKGEGEWQPYLVAWLDKQIQAGTVGLFPASYRLRLMEI